MDLIDEKKLGDALAKVLQPLPGQLSEALKDALDGFTITITIKKKDASSDH